MTNLITQPYRRPSDPAQDNYLVTLATEIDIPELLKKYGVENQVDLTEFIAAHPTGKARIWAVHGNAPGLRVWSKITAGDLVVFYGNNEIYAYGEISSKFQWDKNNYIWPSGSDWDYVYSIRNFTEIQPGHRPIYKELRSILGKLDVYSVGIRNLEEAGVNREEVLKYVLNDAPRSRQHEKVNVKSKTQTPERDASLNPPALGEKFRNRDTIWKAFGGQKQKGIGYFQDDDVLNVFSDEDGPYPDYIDLQKGIIEYRGQGLGTTQRLTDGNKLLETARLSKAPVRFWYRPSGGEWSFYDWVIVADRDVVEDQDKKGVTNTRILWFLLQVHSNDPLFWPVEATSLQPANLVEVIETVPSSTESFVERYRKAGLQPGINTKEYTALPRANYKRSRKLRNLVLERAGGFCEFDLCTGMPPDTKKSGEAILEVDHIHPLGNGGEDHPSNMIALCPNCHGAKTHGKNKTKMMKQLQHIVAAQESKLL